jgi:hypothetical protein
MRTGPTDPEIDRLSAKGRTCDHDMSLTLIVEGRVVDVCSECGVSQDVIDLRARLATAENVVAAARGYVNAGTEKVAKYRRINLDNALRAHERMWPAIPVEP